MQSTMSMDILTVRGFLVFRPIADTMGLQAEYAAEFERRKKRMEDRLSATKIIGLKSVELLVFSETPTLMFYVNLKDVCLIVTSTATDLVQMGFVTPANAPALNLEITDDTLKSVFDAELRRVYELYLDQEGLDDKLPE